MLNYSDLGEDSVLRGMMQMLCLKMETFLPRLQPRAVLANKEWWHFVNSTYLELSSLVYAAEALL